MKCLLDLEIQKLNKQVTIVLYKTTHIFKYTNTEKIVSLKYKFISIRKIIMVLRSYLNR